MSTARSRQACGWPPRARTSSTSAASPRARAPSRCRRTRSCAACCRSSSVSRPRRRVPLSIDTYKAVVAREAVARGAAIVNDISGLQYDPALGRVAADAGAALVLMHTRGRSRDMYERRCTRMPRRTWRQSSRRRSRGRNALAWRATPSSSIPGWASRSEPSTASTCWRRLDRTRRARPADSVRRLRKSFLKAALGDRPPDEREWGTAAAVAASILFGAHIVRVHDVRAMVDVARVADRIRAAGHEPL